MSLRKGKTRALFTGDLNHKLGAYLANSSDFDLEASLLKVPHHGTEGLAPDSFFARVSPKAAFVPAPCGLWQSARSKRPREWFLSRGIPTYVTGEVGSVTVDMLPSRFLIKTKNSCFDCVRRSCVHTCKLSGKPGFHATYKKDFWSRLFYFPCEKIARRRPEFSRKNSTTP